VYVCKVLLEAGFILKPQRNTNGTKLRESGREFYDDKYKADFDNLLNSLPLGIVSKLWEGRDDRLT